MIKGKDPKLERAAQEALALLKTPIVQLKPEPSAPAKITSVKQIVDILR